MQILPNEHGVYTEFTERIAHETESGARIDVYLVEQRDGWRSGFNYQMQWGAGGAYPRAADKPHSSRQDALEAAASQLIKRAADGPEYHSLSDKERRQRSEIRDWCRAQKQMDLFR